MHCKLWRDSRTGRTFALITTGLTHRGRPRLLVAVEVTDRDRHVEVAKLNTPVHATGTEGVLVLGDFAYVGGYVPNNKFVSVALSGLVAAVAALRLRSVVGPRPEYDNMVGALANSSFRGELASSSPGQCALEPGGCTAFRSHSNRNMLTNPARGRRLMFFGSYVRPGGLLII